MAETADISLPWLVTGTWWIPERYRREVGRLAKTGEIVINLRSDGRVNVVRDNAPDTLDEPQDDTAGVSSHP